MKNCDICIKIQKDLQNNMNNKNEKLLKEFTEYCKAHPEQRFWQALKNWSGLISILVSKDFGEPEDTYYWVNKDN